MDTPKRNDPCPCGSGLKYKKCCLPKSSESYHEDSESASSLAQAYRLISEEKWQEAIETLDTESAAAATSSEMLEALAACYVGMEEYLLAADHYEKALTICPESRRPSLNYRLGIFRACSQKFDEAREAFTASRDLQPDQNEKHKMQLILDRLDDISAGTVTPYFFFVQVQLQRAFSEMDSERYEAAATRLERLSQVDPENSAIFYNLGVVYTFLKREDEALKEFQRSVEMEPGYFQTWYNMGQIHLLAKKDLSLALSCFDRAIMIKPDYVSAHYQRGKVYEKLGDLLEAVECWERTLEIDPQNQAARESIQALHRSCHCHGEAAEEH